MIIFKYVILILIFSISTYIGFLKSNEYEKRVKELKDYLNSLNMLKSKIEFTYEPIKEIFKDISKTIYENKDNIFKYTAENTKYTDISYVWKDAVEKYDGSLKKEDREILRMFGKLLGKTDKNGQISEVLLSENFVQKQIEKAEEEKNKNIKLYRSLGVIIGSAIIIIFI